MAWVQRRIQLAISIFLLGAALGSTGCRLLPPRAQELSVALLDGEIDDTPRELYKAVLPTYTIEPPDILMIDVIHVVPKVPYRVRTPDVLSIHVEGTLPDAPIEGVYQVEPGGIVNLGFSYGSSKVGGKTVEEIEKSLEEHLKQYLKEPKVSVSVAELAAKQQIAGEHLVTVGMTISEAKQAIEKHLSRYLDQPEVSVDVYAYNSKVYYVITQGAGMGDGVFRFPITGNETVLDAISQINGLEQVSSKRIWVARAGHSCGGSDRILPVDWNSITQTGEIETNYQILPGDRVYVAEDKLIAFDTGLAKLTAPLERIMGFALMGVGTTSRFSGSVLRGGGNRLSTF